MFIREIKVILRIVGSTVLLCWHALLHLGTLHKQWPRVVEAAYNIGYKTFPIVAIMSLFIGGVLALQTGYSVGEIAGGQSFLGNIVGLSMCQELGPVMASLLLAGRVGSAITAELASMQVYQEIDALRTMNIPPERMLVLPKLCAVLFMMPVLTILAIIIGWYGGAFVCHFVDSISLDYPTYWHGLTRSVGWKDVWDGLVKAEIFGFVVVAVACNEGLSTSGGPREIGRSVTQAVVISMVCILLLDYFITKLQH